MGAQLRARLGKAGGGTRLLNSRPSQSAATGATSGCPVSRQVVHSVCLWVRRSASSWTAGNTASKSL